MMSKKRVLGILFLAISVVGCKETIPSQKMVQEHLYDTVNSFDFFDWYFDIESWDRTNGWKDGDGYVVAASVALKSKIGYVDLLSDCVVHTDPRQNDLLQGLSTSTLALQATLSGTAKEFTEYWSNVPEKMWTTELKDASRRVSQEDWDSLLKACDYNILNLYGTYIGRGLLPGAVSNRHYELRFRQTENGWSGYSN